MDRVSREYQAQMQGADDGEGRGPSCTFDSGHWQIGTSSLFTSYLNHGGQAYLKPCSSILGVDRATLPCLYGSPFHRQGWKLEVDIYVLGETGVAVFTLNMVGVKNRCRCYQR